MLHPLLGRGREAFCVSFPLGVGKGQWTNTGRFCNTPQGQGRYQRFLGELRVEGKARPPQTAWGDYAKRVIPCGERVPELWEGFFGMAIQTAGGQGEVLLNSLCQPRKKAWSDVCLSGVQYNFYPAKFRSREGKEQRPHHSFLLTDLLQKAQDEGNKDPCVRLLQKEIYSTGKRNTKVEVGQVLLLQGVLAAGSALYDLTVEEDHSFVVSGMVLHNSNCRCRLVAKPMKLKPFERIAKKQKTKDYYIKGLRRIRR